MPFLFRLVLSALKPTCLGFILLTASCASVSIDNLRRFETARPLKPPKEILIVPFLFPDEALRVDREGEELRQFKAELQAHFSSELAERLGKHVAPARILPNADSIPNGEFLLVTGKFVTVQQGSRLLRSTVGMGSGACKMETLVSVYDLSSDSRQPVLRFETTGGSNITQGIGGIVMAPITGPMALTSLLHVIDGARSGVSFDATRTSREITATISEHLHNKGILKNNPRLVPKRLGKVPYITPREESPLTQ